MPPKKEALILLLDVGPSMHYDLPAIEKACFMHVQKKLIYGENDLVGLVLFGTKDTNNELATEVGGYQHVVVLRNTEVVDEDILETLQRLPRGTTNVLDAVIVGVDMLIKKFGITTYRKKRLCLITNALCPVRDSVEETNEEKVTTIAKQMSAHAIKMESIILRRKFIMTPHWYENECLLNIFSKETSTRLLYVENPISLFGAIGTRNITPVPVFKGNLEFSPKLSIKVTVYKKTAEEKFPSLKRYSDKAPPNDKSAKHQIKVEYKYKSSEDPDKVVSPYQRIKGYTYGPQIVPISSSEWQAVKFKPEKGVKLLGFTDSSNVSRHHYTKDVYAFLPESGNSKAMLAVSAVARAMKEMNKVAILRCVWRRGQANVFIGVLTPNLTDSELFPDSFYLNVLPFAEDLQPSQFPSFSNLPASCQPNEQQLEAAANLIKKLDLAPHGEDTVLLPDLTPNPVLERFYQYLELKSKDPDAAVPPLDNALKKITEPDADLLLRKKSEIDSFCSCFERNGNPLKKPRRLRGAQAANASDEKIGDLTPVQDFEALISRRDSPDLVEKAINEMKNKIFDLLLKEDSHYPKAMECLVVLRKGCILHQESKQFNDFLKHLCNFCQEKHLRQYLASKKLTLISKSEAVDSEVTDDEVTSFLVTPEPKVD